MNRTSPVSGLKELDRFLSVLPDRLQTGAYRAGLTAAAGIVRDEARLRVPRKTGKLAKAIRSSSARKNQDGTFSIKVQVAGNNHAFLGHMLEWGIAPHIITLRRDRGGKAGRNAAAREAGGQSVARAFKIGGDFVSGSISHPGVKAHPFLVPALDTKAEEAVMAFRDKIVAVIEGKTGFNAAVGMAEAA